MTANNTTPGIIIPIRAKLSIKDAPMIPKATHSGFCSSQINISLNSSILIF